MLVNHASSTSRRLIALFRQCLAIPLLTLAYSLLFPSIVLAAEITVTLIDSSSFSTTPDAKITAYRIDEQGERHWYKRETTDAQGKAVFNLEGLEEGTSFQLSTNHFNEAKNYSDIINSASDVEFKVGGLLLTLLDGTTTTNSPLANHKAQIRQIQPDGSKNWFGSAVSDNKGLIRLNLPVHSEGYEISAKALSGSNKKLERVASHGNVAFVVGNLPLNLTVKNGVTGDLISNANVTAYRLDASGDKHWHSRKDVDASGRVSFDLDGLGEGIQYLLTAKDSNNFKSAKIFSAPGDIEFLFGNSQVTLLNGRLIEQPPMPGVKVGIYRLEGEKRHWYTNVTSNDSGQVLLDLENLNSGQQYVAQVKIEDKHYRANITSAGSSNLVFGELPQIITARVNNTATNQPISGIQVTAYELEGEKKRWRARETTNDQGITSFDFPELANNTPFILELSPFDGPSIKSDLITTAGEVIFNAHVVENGLQLAVKDGSQEGTPPLANTKITIYQIQGEEKQWFARRETDANGLLTLTLPGIDQGQQYRFSAKSPINNATKYSAVMEGLGNHEFVVGNKPVSVSLLHGIDKNPLSDTKITAYKISETGEASWYARLTTDTSGQVLFDLDEIDSGTKYVLKAKAPSGFQSEREVSTSGDFEFLLGNTELQILNGRETPNTPLANASVSIKKVIDEQSEWYANVRTDEQGNALLDLVDTEQGQTYLTQVKIDGKYYRNEVKTTGEQSLVFGEPPQLLRVTVMNSATNSPIAGEQVTIYEWRDEKKHWFTRESTDEQGVAEFDLVGVQDGKQFIAQISPYDGQPLTSEIITEAQEISFNPHIVENGVPVTVMNGSENGTPPLANTKITVYQINGEEKQWFTRKETDELGQLSLQLPGLAGGQMYMLSAKSTVSGSTKYSEHFTGYSAISFVVGNPAINVTLKDAITGNLIPNEKVTAYEIATDGSLNWRGSVPTNEQGLAVFDLDNVSTEKPISFAVNFLGTGKSFSETISEIKDVLFEVGNVPVNLVDRDTNAPISGVKITAYWLNEENKLNWERSGNTDSQGDVIFDLNRLSQGTRYVLKAKNPFGENKSYYGPILYSKGAVSFSVKKGEFGELDLVAPEVAITGPINNNVSSFGFTLQGTATDNQSVSRVQVQLTDPLLGVFAGDAQLSSDNQWQFAIPVNALSIGQNVTVSVTAFDVALNQSSTSQQFTVTEDLLPPELTINSHVAGQSVNETGFSLIGTVSDDSGSANVTGTLVDPVLGTTLDNISVNVAANGQWAFIVTNGNMTAGQTVTVTVTATDTSGKSTNQSLQLSVEAIVPQQQQLISRITFGLTPDLYINQPSAIEFMNQQLAPASVDDSLLEALIVDWVPANLDELKNYQLTRMIFTQRQLNEIMTWFWENHFNTNFNTHQNVAFELAENNGFRNNALGSFRTLLEISATSPAMIYYLNNAQNIAGNPNENYAREIMELHTLGVDGGYTAQDVAELSRIFTGWHEQNGEFFFNDAEHDFDDKTFMGLNIQGTGLDEGMQVLDFLATHPATARTICQKLVTLFVSDVQVATLQTQCEAEFLNTSGDIAAVIRVILSSDAFVSLENQRSKIKTPLELVVSAIRNVNGSPDLGALNGTLNRLGYSLFQYPVPTGLSDLGAEWLSPDALLQRIRFANLYALEGRDGGSVNIKDLAQDLGYSSAEAIVSLLSDLLLSGNLTDLERDVALEILNDGANFDIDSADAEDKLQRLMGTMMSFPGFQYQ